MRNYTFQTPEHAYDIIPDPIDPNTVMIKSEFRDSIEDFLNVIELSGRADDADFQEITIEEDINDYDAYYYIEISKADLAVYFEFEVCHFMGAVPEA